MMEIQEMIKGLISSDTPKETIDKIVEISKKMDEEISTRDIRIQDLEKKNASITSAYVDVVKATGFKTKEPESTDEPPKPVTLEELFAELKNKKEDNSK